MFHDDAFTRSSMKIARVVETCQFSCPSAGQASCQLATSPPRRSAAAAAPPVLARRQWSSGRLACSPYGLWLTPGSGVCRLCFLVGSCFWVLLCVLSFPSVPLGFLGRFFVPLGPVLLLQFFCLLTFLDADTPFLCVLFAGPLAVRLVSLGLSPTTSTAFLSTVRPLASSTAATWSPPAHVTSSPPLTSCAFQETNLATAETCSLPFCQYYDPVDISLPI